ncbi:MAG: polysaccharide deacetylase family protein, partial [Nitrosopumilus sp.]|nr:polysaccharide deacetylase family protein [Nitrosopumilus sp.]
GGGLFTITYNDFKPIPGAKVEVFSQKGTKWAEDITGLDGRTERFWLQPPVGTDEYSATISLGEEVSYDYSKFRFTSGYNDEFVVTPWKSIVDDNITIQLYKSFGQPISNYDGRFVVELFDNNNEKIFESNINSHGESYFSNISTDYYFLRVLQFSDDESSEPTVWAINRVLIAGDTHKIQILGLEDKDINDESDTAKNAPIIESPDETCNCVAFRLDNIQDYYLTGVQMDLINLFLAKNVPLTIGVIGNNIGSDTVLIDFIKENISEYDDLISIGNHGDTFAITSLDEGEQDTLIKNSNENILKLLGKDPSVFIPSFGTYDENTLSILNRENVGYVSSVSSFDLPPYSFKDDSVLRFPSTASTGYIEQGKAWYGIPANQTMSDIKFSIRDYGFAVVLLHPRDFSNNDGWAFEDQINIPQYFELHDLLDEVKDYGLKIVLIDDIDRNAQFFSNATIPNWFKNVALWWAEGKIRDAEFITSVEYLMEEKIIQVPQIENDDNSTGRHIPLVFKNNARLWANDKITTIEFIDNIQVLVKNGVIRVR